MILDRYIDYEIEKYDGLVKNLENGVLTEQELGAREIVFNERGTLLEYMNDEEKIFQTRYYMVVYDSDKNVLMQTVNGIGSTLNGGALSLESSLLEGKELAIFLRANYNKDFDERALGDLPETKHMNWIVPNKVVFTSRGFSVNGLQRMGLKISDYPIDVGNAWGQTLFNIPGTRTVMNFHQVPKLEAEKIIDRAIIEMKTQMEYSQKSSYQIERSTQLETVTNLLYGLKQNNEALFDCTIHISAEWDSRKEVIAKVREEGFRIESLFGRQVDSFTSANVSRLENFGQYVRGIPTTTVAAGQIRFR
jgi:hypothetical protein